MPTTAAMAVHKILTGLPKAMERDALRKAHEHAEDFHAAMARVCECDDEMAEADSDLVDRPYWLKERQDALGKAAHAASLMPALWLQILGVEVSA